MKSARIIIASNRAADGTYPDRSGPLIAQWLAAHGYDAPDPLVVPDGEPVARALRNCLDTGVQVVLTSGGTGIAPTDRTPEMTTRLLDYELPGLADAMRAAGREHVPTAMLSRAVAGVAGSAIVVNLPGSTGGVRDGLAVLDGVLDHAVDQLAGGDHPRADNSDVSAAGGSGGTGQARVARASVTDSPLSIRDHRDVVVERASGAVVTFEGVVRDHDDGRTVLRLDYEGHPSAQQVLTEVVAEIAERRVGVRGVAVSHRIGGLQIGDVALACAVAAEHRSEAFATCAELVDEVKDQLPVWKHQFFSDGTEEWVNSP